MSLKFGDSTLYCIKEFPASFKAVGMKHIALVGMGGNIGDVRGRFRRVLRYLTLGKLFRPIETAPLFYNPPFGFTDQPFFTNTLVLGETNLNAHELLRYLLWVERRFGRKRSFPNAPRSLDLDIIFFDNLQLRSTRLTIPHPNFSERESVVVPMHFLSAENRSSICRG